MQPANTKTIQRIRYGIQADEPKRKHKRRSPTTHQPKIVDKAKRTRHRQRIGLPITGISEKQAREKSLALVNTVSGG